MKEVENWTNKKKGWKKCYARRIHCSNLMGKTKQKLHKKRTKQKQKEKWESNETEKNPRGFFLHHGLSLSLLRNQLRKQDYLPICTHFSLTCDCSPVQR